MQEGETPNEATLTTDREDYPPYSYVYINGTGFEPGETVNMIVVELSPNPASFEPWDVVADENGNIDTSWYIFTEELIGATMQVTATGQTSGLTARPHLRTTLPQFCIRIQSVQLGATHSLGETPFISRET